jgi:hypothetical protein
VFVGAGERKGSYRSEADVNQGRPAPKKRRRGRALI